jgi:hypothetical protein
MFICLFTELTKPTKATGKSGCFAMQKTEIYAIHPHVPNNYIFKVEIQIKLFDDTYFTKI